MRTHVRLLVVAAAILCPPLLHGTASAQACTRVAAPRLSIKVAHKVVNSTGPNAIGGYLTGRDGCILVGEKVGLYVRYAPGRYYWQKAVVTNAQGQYGFAFDVDRPYDVMTVHSATSTVGRAESIADDGKYYVHVHYARIHGDPGRP